MSQGPLQDRRLALIGLGKLGESLVRGLLETKTFTPDRIVATARHQETLASKQDLGVETTLDNAAAVADADIVLLTVEPQSMDEVLASIGNIVREGQLFVSTAAGTPLSRLEAGLGPKASVVRTMPNTPCLVGAGMTVLAPGSRVRPEDLECAEAIFRAVGRTLVLDERHLDAVTGLSGSGPAFFYVVLEALAEGGVKVGLPRATATELAAQTMLGAARLALETGEHPAKLKDAVLTPAGCTIDGLLELEQGGLRTALINAVVCAARRAGELQEED